MPKKPAGSGGNNTQMPPSLAQIAKRNSRKKTRIIFTGPAVVFCLLLSGIVVYSQTTRSSQPAPFASQEQQSVNELAAAISLVEGHVQFSGDDTSWVDLNGGETVSAGDYVRTLSDARVVLLIDDGSAVRLDGDSVVQLSVSDSKSIEIKLLQGQVYSRVIESDKRSFAIVTDTERFEAQGTAFRTSTGEYDTVDVYQSSVKVDTNDTMVEEGNRYDTRTKQQVSIDFDSLAQDDFVQWNKTQDSRSAAFKDKLGILDASETTGQPSAEDQLLPTLPATISLEAQAKDKGIHFAWTLSNGSALNGFKLVRSTNSKTPTFGQNTSIYISNPVASSYELELEDGKTYNFRLCVYHADRDICDTYSNSVTATSPNKPLIAIEPGGVSLTIDDSLISWTFNGTAPYGFKVVMSEAVNPVYPTNSIKLVGPGTTEVQLPEKPSGTYYVKVCKYTASSEVANGCTNYSNQVEYTVTE